MFREMRLKENNQLTHEQALEILENGVYGVLALDGDNGYAYASPVNYVYNDGRIYFHGAPEGQKVDAIRRNKKVSFCVVEKAEIVPQAFNCLYRSAIAFGKARIVEDKDEKQQIMEMIIDRYSKGFEKSGKKYIRESWDEVMAFVIDTEHITGKKGTP